MTKGQFTVFVCQRFGDVVVHEYGNLTMYRKDGIAIASYASGHGWYVGM